MNRRLGNFRTLLAVGLTLCGATMAFGTDSIGVTRSNGILDAFAVVPCTTCAPGTVELRHTAIAASGTGEVISNDYVGTPGPVLNLINAFWISSSTDGAHNELHVRAYTATNVIEYIWNANNIPTWSGPYELK